MRTMIGKEAENKTRGNNVEQNVLHNAPISDADVVPLIPSIPEVQVLWNAWVTVLSRSLLEFGVLSV